MSWAAEAGAVFVKEVRTEWRTRVALSSVALFALASLTLIGLGLRGAALTLEAKQSVAGALLWVLLFFTAATGLGRTFVQETERGTATALRLSARATTVWAGKWAANSVLLLALSVIAAPVLLAILEVRASSVNAGLLACVVVLGGIGLSAVMTLTAALVAQASAKSGLLAALSFPLLAPLFLAGVDGAKTALGWQNPALAWTPAAWGDLQVLGSYAVVAVTAALLLFDFVWND